jgi:hypothetical protein
MISLLGGAENVSLFPGERKALRYSMRGLG